MHWTKWRTAQGKRTRGSRGQGGAQMDGQAGDELKLSVRAGTVFTFAQVVLPRRSKSSCVVLTFSQDLRLRNSNSTHLQPQRRELPLLQEDISPLSKGWGRETLVIPTRGFWWGMRKRTRHCWTTSKAKNALKGIFVMFFTLLCWPDGSMEHLFSATELLMEKKILWRLQRLPSPALRPPPKPHQHWITGSIAQGVLPMIPGNRLICGVQLCPQIYDYNGVI